MSASITIWLKRLEDDDIGVRRAAIQTLEDIGDPLALAALALIFATDSDADTRRLAQRAGKTIYQNTLHREADSEGSPAEQRRQAAEILKQASHKRARRH